MRNCKKKAGDFCDCEELPCKRLKSLDKRYRNKYEMSMVENLKVIQKHGINKFLKQQERKYITKKGIFCVHDKKYHKTKF